MGFNKEVCSVVTTFRPNKCAVGNVKVIAEQSFCIVVDDTGIDNKHLFEHVSNTLYIQNYKNRGIAYSLNVGVKKAKSLGFKFCTTFDDDTIVSPSYINDIYHIFISNNSFLNIGMLTLERVNGFYSNVPDKIELREKRGLITSGAFFKIEIFDLVGGFSNNYFIDLVDFHFSTRVRLLGLKLYSVNLPGMIHSVGNSRRHHIFKDVTIYNHSPFRLYYQVRNTCPYLKEFIFKDFLLTCYIFLDVLRIPAKAIIFEEDKLIRLRFCFKGLIHGVLGKMGRLDE